jgi:hypothetical protein
VRIADPRLRDARAYAFASVHATALRLWALRRMKRHLGPNQYRRELRDIRANASEINRAILLSEGLR